MNNIMLLPSFAVSFQVTGTVSSTAEPCSSLPALKVWDKVQDSIPAPLLALFLNPSLHALAKALLPAITACQLIANPSRAQQLQAACANMLQRLPDPWQTVPTGDLRQVVQDVLAMVIADSDQLAQLSKKVPGKAAVVVWLQQLIENPKSFFTFVQPAVPSELIGMHQAFANLLHPC